MASTSYDLDNAAIVYGGNFANAYLNAQRAKFFQGAGAQLDFTAAGTDCTLRLAVTATGTNYLQASIDGGAFANVTMPGSANTYADCTLFTGLADSAHAVTVKHAAGTQANVQMQYVGGVTVTGAAPALSLSSGFGPAYKVGTPEGWHYFVPEGVVAPSTSSGHDILLASGNGVDGGVRFRANPTSVKVFLFRNTTPTVYLLQDGVSLASVSPSNTATWEWVTLASGLDGAQHTYQVGFAVGGAFNLVQVMLVGGDVDAAEANIPAWRRSILWVGDSIPAGVILVGGTTNNSATAFPRTVCEAKGYACLNNSKSGQTTLATSTTAGGEAVNPPGTTLTYYRDQVSYVVVELGTNDATAVLAEFQAAYTRLLRKLKAAYPTASVLCLGVLPCTTGAMSAATLANLRGAQQNAVTAVGSPCTYVDTSSWIDTATDLWDSRHPKQAGHDKIAAQLEALIPPAAALTGRPANRGALSGGRL